MNAGVNAFYVAGGTLHPEARSYVERRADHELLASLRLLNRARTEYSNSIADYNLAQLELYVHLSIPSVFTGK